MVRLREYQGKQLLEKVGIPIPRSGIATTVQEAIEIVQEIKKPVMIKAQVLTTGRYKAGGIKSADTVQEVQNKVEDMFGKEIKGLKVEKVLIEEKLEVAKEFYMSVTINDSYKVRAPVILFSVEGGVDIEEIAEKNPEAISRMSVDYIKGFQTSDANILVSKLLKQNDLIDKISEIACKLYEVFVKWDANTVEINPLVLTTDGQIVAVDCRITLDDNSVFRHQDEFNIELPRDMTRAPTELEKIAWKIEESDYRGTCYFIQLNPDFDEIRKGGYIAFHGIGGGASMLAADALMKAGIKLATYVDTSGNPAASKVYRAIKVLLSIPAIEGYCLAGAVLANQEQWYHAYAVVKALREEAKVRPGFPVLILIAGNKEDESHKIIKDGLKDFKIRWELYGRDHIYDLEFIAERMKFLIQEYQKDKGTQENKTKISLETTDDKTSDNHLVFETQTGKMDIDINKCIAPECGFACVKADRWIGRPCLKIDDRKPALANTSDELKRLCNECLACQIECDLHGGSAISITLPVYGLEEFRKKHTARLEG